MGTDIDLPILLVLAVLVATCTWYGPAQTNGDPFTASWWHHELPEGAPAVVDYEYFGVATALRDIPFGTRIRFTVLNTVREEDRDIVGNTVIAVVVDRLGDEDGEVEFDLWPVAFKVLAGDLDVGVLYVKAETLGDEKHIEDLLWELKIR